MGLRAVCSSQLLPSCPVCALFGLVSPFGPGGCSGYLAKARFTNRKKKGGATIDFAGPCRCSTFLFVVRGWRLYSFVRCSTKWNKGVEQRSGTRNHEPPTKAWNSEQRTRAASHGGGKGHLDLQRLPLFNKVEPRTTVYANLDPVRTPSPSKRSRQGLGATVWLSARGFGFILCDRALLFLKTRNTEH